MSPFQALTSAKSAREARLEHVRLAGEPAHLLAFGDHGPVAGGSEEGGNPGAARADALGEGALRVELDLERAVEEHLLEDLVLADVGRDHLPDLAVLQQERDPEVVDARVVRDDGEALRSLVASARIRFSGIPHSPKPETITVAPSGTSRTASAALFTTLFMLAPRAAPGRLDDSRAATRDSADARPSCGADAEPRRAQASAPAAPRGSAFAFTSCAAATALGTSPRSYAADASAQAWISVASSACAAASLSLEMAPPESSVSRAVRASSRGRQLCGQRTPRGGRLLLALGGGCRRGGDPVRQRLGRPQRIGVATGGVARPGLAEDPRDGRELLGRVRLDLGGGRERLLRGLQRFFGRPLVAGDGREREEASDERICESPLVRNGSPPLWPRPGATAG